MGAVTVSHNVYYVKYRRYNQGKKRGGKTSPFASVIRSLFPKVAF